MTEQMSEEYIQALQSELLRVVGAGERFTVGGETIEGATETDTIEHLTSKRGGRPGRKHLFPGLGSGWAFQNAIEKAGFRIVQGTNRRGQPCRIVTI